MRSALTKAEVILWSLLRRRAVGGFKFRRQHPIGPYIADFACVEAKLVVEVDGATHWTEAELAHDAKRTGYFGERGWRVLRFVNGAIYEDADAVWRSIEAALCDHGR